MVLCTCTVYNPLAKAQGLSLALRTGAQTMFYPRIETRLGLKSHQ